MINELKRELSKISGVDFFNPKYRDVFKKYFSDDKDEKEEEQTPVMNKETDAETKAKEVKEKVEDIDKAEDEREIDKIEEEKAESPEKRDEKEEEVQEESEEIGEDVDELKEDKTNDELLEVKIENELLKGGVREEKLGAAMRLAKAEVASLNELDKVKEILAEFPEWVRGYKARGFGMDVDRDTDNLTAEERRMKELGIDPHARY